MKRHAKSREKRAVLAAVKKYRGRITAEERIAIFGSHCIQPEAG